MWGRRALASLCNSQRPCVSFRRSKLVTKAHADDRIEPERHKVLVDFRLLRRNIGLHRGLRADGSASRSYCSACTPHKIQCGARGALESHPDVHIGAEMALAAWKQIAEPE